MNATPLKTSAIVFHVHAEVRNCCVVIGNYGCSIGFCRLSPWRRGEDGGEGFEACTTEMSKGTLTLPSPKPTLLPSLALARPSLPAGERRERRLMRVQLVLLRWALLCTAPGAVVKNW